jgi:hypothetical protein
LLNLDFDLRQPAHGSFFVRRVIQGVQNASAFGEIGFHLPKVANYRFPTVAQRFGRKEIGVRHRDAGPILPRRFFDP